jgi:hypothetical protein
LGAINEMNFTQQSIDDCFGLSYQAERNTALPELNRLNLQRVWVIGKKASKGVFSLIDLWLVNHVKTRWERKTRGQEVK